MIISNKSIDSIPKNCKIFMKQNELEQVNQIKYLGIIIDNKLTWKPHNQNLCTKLFKAPLFLLKLRFRFIVNIAASKFY